MNLWAIGQLMYPKRGRDVGDEKTSYHRRRCHNIDDIDIYDDNVGSDNSGYGKITDTCGIVGGDSHGCNGGGVSSDRYRSCGNGSSVDVVLGVAERYGANGGVDTRRG
ncbi:Hypothetical predicted protein [Octopus vulgaris]|uniref:Uncharacterized protein n=1 Tax=Octopus vulgaris TaxID=6645 RepID=A0AA36EXA5_OCTVU|nr:Hypothetical predicted protein [Octopus vulgaris]